MYSSFFLGIVTFLYKMHLVFGLQNKLLKGDFAGLPSNTDYVT